MRRSKICISNE